MHLECLRKTHLTPVKVRNVDSTALSPTANSGTSADVERLYQLSERDMRQLERSNSTKPMEFMGSFTRSLRSALNCSRG